MAAKPATKARPSRRTGKRSRKPDAASAAAEQEAHLDGLIAGARFRRALRRAEVEEQRRALAHTAREIAAHLTTLAVLLDHDPLEDDEVTRYANVLRIISGLTSDRRALPKPARKTENEPFTLEDLRKGAVNPLGDLWAAWTQVFNRTEFGNDRDAMIAVTRTLRALRLAFWNSDRETPLPRSKRDTDFLRRVSVLAHRYLAPNEHDPVLDRPHAIERLRSQLAREMHQPFFIWSAPDKMRHTLLWRRDPESDELSALADKITDSLCGSLRHGYSGSVMARRATYGRP